MFEPIVCVCGITSCALSSLNLMLTYIDMEFESSVLYLLVCEEFWLRRYGWLRSFDGGDKFLSIGVVITTTISINIAMKVHMVD